MDEAQSFIDGLQSALDSVTTIWNDASTWIGSLVNGTETIGGIILAVIGVLVVAGAGFLVSHFSN